MECPSCGIRLMSGERECPSCGTRLEGEGGLAGPPESEFRIAKESKEFRDLLNYLPSSVPRIAQQVSKTTFGLVFIFIAVFVILFTRDMDGDLRFWLAAVFFAIVGVGYVLVGVSGLAGLTSRPLERLLAVVVWKSEEYDTGSGSTSYYVTLQTENGNRKEHLVPGKLYSQLERGDTGVAYLKGGFLLDFRRLRWHGHPAHDQSRATLPGEEGASATNSKENP
jgi:hypothetical protein